MRIRFFINAGMCAALLGVMPQPVRAQIAIFVDDHGKRVYVNAEPPAVRRSAPAKSGKRAAARQVLVPRSRVVRASRLPQSELDRIVREAADRHKVDPVLVMAVIKAESDGNAAALSRKGAQGLMQLVPGTAEKMGVGDAFDPSENVNGGVKYLRMLLERYNGDLDKALAAYNAGPRAVDRAQGVPNIPETRAYVQKITDTYFRPGSGRGSQVMGTSRPIYRITDERGRVIFVNE